MSGNVLAVSSGSSRSLHLCFEDVVLTSSVCPLSRGWKSYIMERKPQRKVRRSVGE